ncbi:hypothetical protein [Arcobacter sp. FWKO B]|uniref:hypothetical protein n=1 Tax=Arcobacter sp. FWKO B TaxID=2593672 RepID=UPI001908EF8C|nr:hypothetical protein [Arcobacter sp. FWKO B]
MEDIIQILHDVRFANLTPEKSIKPNNIENEEYKKYYEKLKEYQTQQKDKHDNNHDNF